MKIFAASLAAVLAVWGVFGPASQPNPVEAARLNNLGVAYMNQQLFEKGLKHFQQAAEADPKFAIARLNEGVAYLNLQKVDEAKAALENALKQDPKNPNAWYSLGLLAKNTGDAQASIGAFKHVIDIDPSDPDTWYFLGTAYAQAKQFPQAIDAFEHALKINPLHASAEFGLSRAYQQSSDIEHAREHLKKFQYITQNKIGSPMSLAYGEQGQYSRAVESPLMPLKPPAQIKVRFVDVTKEVGIADQTAVPNSAKSGLGPGACFLDIDNDGVVDLFLSEGGAEGGIALYHNKGNGSLEEITRKAGLDPLVHAISCTAGDYDNDGFTDLALGLEGKVQLFHNGKSGTFSNVTDQAGIKSDKIPLGMAFVDYDHDGDLDLYVTRAEAIDIEKLMTGQLKASLPQRADPGINVMWRNNGDGTFTDVTESTGLADSRSTAAIGTDYNNDRAVDMAVASSLGPIIFENPREGRFTLLRPWSNQEQSVSFGLAVLDFDHDGWMDVASNDGTTLLWKNNHGKFERANLPAPNWMYTFGIAAFDYDNDGWVDLVAAGETKDGKGEVRLFRNLGPDGFKDVSADIGLDKVQLKDPRAIVTADYDSDGATDLLITQNHGPAILLRNEGATQNHWLKLSLKGLNDNKSAIGTKVEVFSGGNRQKLEIYGSNGYLGQNSTDIVVGLGQSKDADIVRMLWPTGVLQDEIQVPGDKKQEFLEIDRRGSSCPTLFAWNGQRYEFIADMLGAGVVGHWVGPGQRDVPRPVEYIKIPRESVREKNDKLSFRFMEPLEEAVYLDQVRLMAVDHPADVEVYPNEYFASNPPYPQFKVVVSKDTKPVAGAWDDRGHDVRPDLLAHRYTGDFGMTQFQGFANTHSLTLDLGESYNGGPLWLLMHGEIEYFTANSMYAASQAGLQAISPYVEALGPDRKWKRVIDDMGFPAGGPRTMTADFTNKVPKGTRKIRITTNLQIYWDNILVSRAEQPPSSDTRAVHLTSMPLAHADLEFHGYPYKIEGTPAGNVQYIYEKTSATGPYTRPTGTYTRYGDVGPLLTSLDDKFAVFGSGDEVRLEFDPSKLPQLPKGWVRDYFFAANGYEKDMDFYAAEGNYVAPLPFLSMGEYPYPPKRTFPLDDSHLKYLLEYNTRHMSGNEQRGYWFGYGETC